MDSRLSPFQAAFTAFKSLFVRSSPIMKVPLDISLEELCERVPVSPTQEESEWFGCVDYHFKMAGYLLIAQVENGKVVGYIHNTERYRQKRSLLLRKLTDFLVYYGERSPLESFTDNGFGIIFKSKDQSLRASYSYVCDIFSINYLRLNLRETVTPK